MQTTTDLDAKGFLRSLYDFKFTSLIATKVLRSVYLILVVLYSLFAVLGFVAIASRGGAGVVAAIIFVPIYYILSLIFLRIFMEVLIVFFGMGEDLHAMRAGASAPTVPPARPSAIASTPAAAPVADAVRQAPQGWYADPGDPTQERFWDGSALTDRYRPNENRS